MTRRTNSQLQTDNFKFMAGIGGAGAAIAVTIDALAGGDSTRALAGAAATLFAFTIAAGARAHNSLPATPAAYAVPLKRRALLRLLGETANDPAPVIGKIMPDGTVYAGMSPTNGKPMYTTPKDTGLCGTWYKAMDYAAKLDAHGHTDWRLPTKAELNQLFTQRAAIGNFNEKDSVGSFYLSSSPAAVCGAWVQSFRHGRGHDDNGTSVSSLRCVRG